jgi:signal transduction histidine kinase
MTNPPASPAVKRGSILRLQLASLLKPRDTGQAGGFTRSADSRLGTFGLSLKRPAARKPVFRKEFPPITALGDTPSAAKVRTTFTSTRWLSWVNAQNPSMLAIFSALIVLAIGVIDFATGPEISFAIFYLLPIIIASWFVSKRAGLLIAALAGVLGLVADLSNAGAIDKIAVPVWNDSARLCIFVLVVVMLARIRTLQNGLEETVLRRTQQLEVETARGLAMEREVAAVSTREQQRIAHELHDGLGQELGGLAFQAKVLAARLADGGIPHSQEAERLVSLLNQSIARTRSLSNLLDPVGTESGGLRQALSHLVDRSGRVFGTACTFSSPEALPPVSKEAELDLYRIAQEAIHNAAQHGQASEVQVRVTASPEALVLSIRDNGHGFVPVNSQSMAAHRGNHSDNDQESANGAAPKHDRGMGLRIMRYRAAGLNARLEIGSEAGRGTKVVCTMPLT